MIGECKILYDRKSNSFSQSIGVWAIKERDPHATLNQLQINGMDLVFNVIDVEYYKGLSAITEDRSSILKDMDCDGASFIDNSDKFQWVLVELKSNFSIEKIIHAYIQTIHTFIKLQILSGILRSYRQDRMTLNICVACKCMKDEKQKAAVFQKIKDFQNLDRKSFIGDYLYALIDKGYADIKLCNLFDILVSRADAQALNDSLREDILNLNARLFLFLTDGSSDSKITKNITELLV